MSRAFAKLLHVVAGSCVAYSCFEKKSTKKNVDYQYIYIWPWPLEVINGHSTIPGLAQGSVPYTVYTNHLSPPVCAPTAPVRLHPSRDAQIGD